MNQNRFFTENQLYEITKIKQKNRYTLNFTNTF